MYTLYLKVQSIIILLRGKMENIIAYGTMILTAGITPGPNNFNSLTNSSKVGFKKNIPLTLGMSLGIFIVASLSALLSNALSTIIPEITIYLKIICSAYLLWLIIKLWLPQKSNSNVKSANGFIQGLLFQFINTKVWLFAISSMSLYVLPFYQSFSMHMLFAAFHATSAFIEINIWGLCGYFLKNIFDKYKIAANVILSLALLYCIISVYL